ncbi:hypothetical protein [Frankia sp. Cr2]|nr:hypothetical protein [Frankia sp. Cr2]
MPHSNIADLIAVAVDATDIEIEIEIEILPGARGVQLATTRRTSG